MDEKELKEKEKQEKIEKKILDEADENFCGFIGLQIVDQDGHPKMVKGSGGGGPLFIERVGGMVHITSYFTPNPLKYTAIERDTGLYLTGELAYGEPKVSPTNMIGRLVPVSCGKLTTELEKSSTADVDVQVELPFLKNCATRLATLTVATKEEKFVTKIVGTTLKLSEADWMEWKKYKLSFFRLSKAGTPPSGGDDKEEKKDEEKKE